MNRILVIGCPGSGKSVFSRSLNELTGIPLHHLDMIHWRADRTFIPREQLIEELKKIFSEYGQVDTARVVMNRFTGKSKGFGFVVMPNRAEAEKAIAANSEKEYKGRKMRVNEAKNTMVNE